MKPVRLIGTGQYDNDADWLDGYPNRVGGSVITGTDATVVQYCSYIRGLPTEDWALSNRPAVWINVLEYPPVLVKCSNDTDTAWIVLRCVWLYTFLARRIEMSSNRLTPVATRPRTIEEVPSNSSASFLKRVSESNLDKLYDLPEGIQDVMGLQALRPSAAVCKVMTIPYSNCVRIVTPDEHVPTGFHEILNMTWGRRNGHRSEIGCLRLDWPKDLFSFVGRYQLELEHMRKECRDRFGGSSSGTCPTCDKYIQVNLGKHVGLYQPGFGTVMALPSWLVSGLEGDISGLCGPHAQSTQYSNLGERGEPGAIVTREQWHSMSRPSVSGIAIDTFLFSRIGTPLFHQYRVFDRLGFHPAFRGPYMSKLFTFLKESDSESIRRSHRRRAKEIAVNMSKQTSENKNAPTDTTLSRRSVQRTVVSKITGRDAGLSLIPTAGGRPRSSASSMYRRSMEEDTVQN